MIESVANYLDEVETPKQMIDAMVATGSAEIRWVDSDNDGLENPPSIAEWKDASCGSVTAQEKKTSLNLGVERIKKGLSQQDELLWKLLAEKIIKKNKCDVDLLNIQRAKLRAP
jgi:hypothetical protein